MTAMCQVVERDIAALRPYVRNARTHSRKQIQQIARSIERFGFTNPVLISDDGEIIAGHGRVEAAKLLGRRTVPTLALSHLSPAERRAYVLADNKLALNAGWDLEILAIELQALVDLEFEIEVTGFSLAEVDFALDEAREASPDAGDAPEDAVPELAGEPVTRLGDLWQCPSSGAITARVDAKYSSDFYYSVFNTADTRSDDYVLANASIKYTPDSDNWSLQLYVRNIFDTQVFANAVQNFNGGANNYQFQAPRTYGLRASVSF